MKRRCCCWVLTVASKKAGGRYQGVFNNTEMETILAAFNINIQGAINGGVTVNQALAVAIRPKFPDREYPDADHTLGTLIEGNWDLLKRAFRWM